MEDVRGHSSCRGCWHLHLRMQTDQAPQSWMQKAQVRKTWRSQQARSWYQQKAAFCKDTDSYPSSTHYYIISILGFPAPDRNLFKPGLLLCYIFGWHSNTSTINLVSFPATSWLLHSLPAFGCYKKEQGLQRQQEPAWKALQHSLSAVTPRTHQMCAINVSAIHWQNEAELKLPK